MKGKVYALGLDFGTNSVRALLVELSSGEEVADAVSVYPSGEQGVILDEKNDLVARQHPGDWLSSMTRAVRACLKKAKAKSKDFSPQQVIGIGVDTTGSTPLPLDRKAKPLAFHKEFERDLGALAWLWKDHSSYAEAEEISELARKLKPHYLEMYGGTYSSEWFWSKILHCRRTSPKVFRSAYTWAEASDWIPAVLCGVDDASQIKRNICSAGHKGMFNRRWGGYPEKDFLAQLDPELAELRQRLPNIAYPSNQPAGVLCKEWAKKLGLCEGIPVAIGALDAHYGAVGSGIKPGRLVKIIGTSTCDMMVMPKESGLSGIPGIPGVVEDSILPGYIGIESGQSAVGDIFNWFVSQIAPFKLNHDKLTEQAKKLAVGENGLIALDWNNGNRSVLMDARLSGLLVGQSLLTSPAEIYRALIEATAFGARVIIERLEEYGLAVKEIVCCGGISEKNDLLLQIYADVLGRPMKLAKSPQACALGACIFASVVAGKKAGGFASAQEAQRKLCGLKPQVFKPKKKAQKTYEELYQIYLALHNAFGGVEKKADLGWVMKKLLEIKEKASKKGARA